jgi:glycine dehydrogenase subunit 2
MSTVNASGWKPEMGESDVMTSSTYTGNRALMLEEALIFEIGDTHTTGVDLETAPVVKSRLGGLDRNREMGFPAFRNPKRSAITPA